MDRTWTSDHTDSDAAPMTYGHAEDGVPFEWPLREEREPYRPTYRSDAQRLDAARDWIIQHMDRPGLNPGALAKALHMSRRALYLLFSAHGLTPSTVICDQRLARCKAALNDPRCKQKITTIALDAGFRHISTFSRLFKARYGVSPNEYRERAKARRTGTFMLPLTAFRTANSAAAGDKVWLAEPWWNLPTTAGREMKSSRGGSSPPAREFYRSSNCGRPFEGLISS